MKTDLSDMSITSVRASIGQVRTTLKIWNDIDNTTSDDPVLEKIITEDNVKIYVEGETPEALAARVKSKIKDQVQGNIDNYQNETEKINNITSAFQTMITQVDGELQSKEKI